MKCNSNIRYCNFQAASPITATLWMILVMGKVGRKRLLWRVGKLQCALRHLFSCKWYKSLPFDTRENWWLGWLQWMNNVAWSENSLLKKGWTNNTSHPSLYLPTTTLPYDVPQLLIFSFMDSCPARVICRLPRKPNFFGQLEEDDISRESQIAIATSCNNLILY